MNALSDPKLGKYINEHFVSAFEKVGTFRIVGRQKQGGNVASYFCAQDGRVLHVVAGPVNAATLLREARWVVDTVKKTLAENKQSGKSFKSQFRRAHAERLRKEHRLIVQPVMFDAPLQCAKSALSYRDPSGKTLAPVLPPPPIDGPDVSLTAKQNAEFVARQDAALKTACPQQIVLGKGRRRWVLSNQGRVHVLLAAHSMKKIETIYGSIFEGILGEKVSTKPVEVTTPFPWVRLGKAGIELRPINVTPNGLQRISR